MNGKRKIVVTGFLLLLALSFWFLALPKLRFSAARKKYAVGMSLETAKRIAKTPNETVYPAYNVSPEWKSGEMPEAAKQTTVVTGLSCPKECVLLGFNSYSNLIEVQPINDPIDTFLWLRSKSRSNEKGT